MQFAHNCLYAHTALTDAGTYRVNTLLCGGYCHFGALAGFAGNCANLHDAMKDFRYFIFQQTAQKVFMGAWEQNLRAFVGVFHFGHQSAHTVVNVKALVRDHILTLQSALGFHLQPDGDTNGRSSLHQTTDHLSQLLFIISDLWAVFGFTNLLCHHLARGLSGHSTKFAWGGFDLGHHNITEIDIGVKAVCIFQVNLGTVILHFFHDLFFGKNAHFSLFQINFGANFLPSSSVDGFYISRFNCLAQSFQNDLFGQLLIFQ